MGYTTKFEGKFIITPPVNEELRDYINKFSSVRHMKRNNKKIKKIFPDYATNCFHGLLRKEGEYFVGGTGFAGQDFTEDIINYDIPPVTQPSLWCQWIISEDGKYIEWDQGEKFYCYVEWLKYLIHNFLTGHVVNGKVHYQGEDDTDAGYIVVEENKITVHDDLPFF